MHPDVAHLQDEVSKANFVNALSLVKADYQRWIVRDDIYDLDLLRYRCLAAEVFDHAGQYALARRVIRPIGLKSQVALAETKHIPQTDRSLWKQRAWAALQLGFADYYRRQEDTKTALKDALSLFQLAENTFQQVQSDAYPCLGSQSRIKYMIGLVHRQRHEYLEAKKYFAEAIDLASRRLERSEKSRPFYEFAIARSLALGLGWVHYTEGSLSTARPLIISARGLLANKNELFLSEYICHIFLRHNVRPL